MLWNFPSKFSILTSHTLDKSKWWRGTLREKKNWLKKKLWVTNSHSVIVAMAFKVEEREREKNII
jgi:hypothetical protein